MNDRKEEIKKLLADACKSGPEMTHGLKNVGDGDMKRGITILAEYFEENGIKKGAIGGTVGTLTVLGLIAVVKKAYDMNKTHKEKGEKIVKGLQQGMDECEQNNEQEIKVETE